MTRFSLLLRSFAPTALGAAATASRAIADPIVEQPAFGVFPTGLLDGFDPAQLLPWVAGCIAVAAVAVMIGDRLRRRRRDMRQAILGLGNGPRFRAVDAICHAVWKGRKIEGERLKRALEIARATTDMDYTADHIREAAARADRVHLPLSFRWMREGLTDAEKMVIFNSTLSVLLADAPLTHADRAFLGRLTRGLGLKRRHLRNLGRLLPE
ncbi:hypothetical protein [uncultured Jannaschia sp.]|uniref:hypothetical protein n=1 Tax=uncultured Jannaschia sp. TaxID=293347 RepID=UPI00262D11FB|nr:hypothetical protein [uncultured Jannaschia sp.]